MRSKLETLTSLLLAGQACAKINRQKIVQQFNPHRTASSDSTPLQVGNGDFAFGADVTGLQTFQPFNTLSTWCWHNSSLPTAPNQTEPADFVGLDWWTHGRLVNYEQPNPAKPDISQWMISNPHRANLGRVGLWFGDNITESDVSATQQELDLYSGTITSSFKWGGEHVQISTYGDPATSSIAVEVSSALLQDGYLGVFFDYPYMNDLNKFEAPFVGLYNATANHTTRMVSGDHHQACIEHTMDATTYYTTVHWNQDASLTGPLPHSHRYVLKPHGDEHLTLTVSYHDTPSPREASFYSPGGQGARINTDFEQITTASAAYWEDFWETGAFVDMTKSGNTSAMELQRRVILSQYLEAVNEAGFDPPQESGLVNNGWYGKFHAEMFLWHLGHWGRWGQWGLQNRAMPGVYERFLPTSIERAKRQGYEGARWGKMSDPTGRSAPGEINSLLIWQQPHPMQFAEYEWRAFPNDATLQKWDEVLYETAAWMADYAYCNESTGVYDLGPPIYPVSENTDPNATFNAAFELAYWRFGLDTASQWQKRQGKPVPAKWTHVAENLAPLPVADETYVIYEGIDDMWHNTTYTTDHQSMLGIYGWLPPQPDFNLTIMQNTVEHVYSTWNFTDSYGWDFPLLTMNAARLGEVDRAVDWLLDSTFEFDDAGYQVGGARVPTPYMPGAASLLWAVAMLASGWDGHEGSHFPSSWNVEVEGFLPAM
ncbi:uncharacterized protein LTR77_010106 [Saxophila tyrrhenica]|uniref:Six-hairpin glycosidase-like protein n=1 Tax=Saxophila tyrrhenica TaxID=1690608 RepID=A0AAV9NWF9_9PEZI|nr:hypothetical protein LTR77_010106 [Saxophila tyrrhenica]